MSDNVALTNDFNMETTDHHENVPELNLNMEAISMSDNNVPHDNIHIDREARFIEHVENWIMEDFEQVVIENHGLYDSDDEVERLNIVDINNLTYEELMALYALKRDMMYKLYSNTFKFPSQEYEVDKDEVCCICQNSYQIGEDVSSLTCRHIFHLDCITPWLFRKKACPICKVKFPTQS